MFAKIAIYKSLRNPFCVKDKPFFPNVFGQNGHYNVRSGVPVRTEGNIFAARKLITEYNRNMRKFFVTATALAVCFGALAQPRLREDNVDEVLKALTLEEKVQLLVGGAVKTYKDGVPTGTSASVPGAAGCTKPVERLGIPAVILSDGPAGVHIDATREGTDRTFYATGFPVGTLLASSWDVNLVREATAAIGDEAREYGIDIMLSPGMNIHRNPLCGRNFEYFSEDPVLSGKMGAAYVKGLQDEGVGTSVKHFAANNQESNRNMGESRVSQRALREIYLKNFEIAIKEAQPWTVMAAYNKLNGPFCQQNYDLLTTVLRDEWGYKGVVVTDWGCKDGTVEAVKAGNDLMEPGEQVEMDRILAAVKDGRISMDEIDRNVRRILEMVVKTNTFRGYKYSDAPDLKAHAAVARRVAGESIVMLKNEQALPLSSGTKVALFGMSSVDFVAGGTGSGNVNKAYVVPMDQALEEDGFIVDEDLKNYYNEYKRHQEATWSLAFAGNPLAMALLRFSGSKIAEPVLPQSCFPAKAESNDVAVIVIGRNAGEVSDRRLTDDFELTETERQLVRNVADAFHAKGKKVVMVLNVGGVIETASWKGYVDAIVLPWSPGQEGSRAVADILCGKINPSGKLPMTFPVSYFDVPSALSFPYEYNKDQKLGVEEILYGVQSDEKNVGWTSYDEGIYVGYRYYVTAGKAVSYPFGFGLSYTSFSYSKPVVKAGKDGFTASVTVTNTGSVAGKEAVQLYVSAPDGGLDKPARELKAFAKTRQLEPGESQTLTMTVSAYDLASFDEAFSRWETAAGTYKVQFGASVDDIRCTATFNQKKSAVWPVNDVLKLK